MDPLQEKGIFARLMGGLGNQMWIVAAGMAASSANGCPLYIPQNTLENNKHNHCKNNYSESIFRHCDTLLDRPQNEELERALVWSGYRHHIAGRQSGFAPWNLADVGPGVILDSYYQYYPAIRPFEDAIRERFLLGLEEHRQKMQSQFGDCSASAFLHIRRGDYMKLPHFHYIQPISYYKHCVDKLMASAEAPKRIYVFSDDVSWIQSHPYFQSRPDLFVIVDLKDELESLALMSLCERGAICANSTFSWWGAFLGAYRVRNSVFVPEKWIGDKVYNLFPLEWTVVREVDLLPRIRDPQTVFVTLCSEGHYSRALKTIRMLREKGGWCGDVVMITVDFRAAIGDLESLNVLEYPVAHLDLSELLAQYAAHPRKEEEDGRIFGKLYQWDKFAVFSPFFQRWKRIVFLDAGIHTVGSVEPLLRLDYAGKILAPDDADPYDNGRRFACQLDLEANPEATERLFQEYPRSILEERYFLNCMFVFDTALLARVSMESLTAAMNAYPICRCNEMTVMNLLLTMKEQCWVPFPQKVMTEEGEKYLFGWSERNYKENPSWSQFHFLKYPVTYHE